MSSPTCHLFTILVLAESKMYQIEVLTTSESQETRIVRFNPQAVQRAVEDSLKNKIQVSVRCLKWAAPCTIRLCQLSLEPQTLQRCWSRDRLRTPRQILIYMSSRLNLSRCVPSVRRLSDPWTLQLQQSACLYLPHHQGLSKFKYLQKNIL